MDRSQAKKRILCDCGEGWLGLVDEAYDNLPGGVEITAVFQKYASLRIEAAPVIDTYERLLLDIETRSESICEVCGKDGSICIRNSWERVMCDAHCVEWRTVGTISEA